MSLARLFEAIESYRHYHYYQRECLWSNSVVVHSLNVYKYRVLSCSVFLPSIMPLLVFNPLFPPPCPNPACPNPSAPTGCSK
jgi:hypothetical protein